MKLDWSARGRVRVYALTVLGTALCIGFSFAFDSYSFATRTWRWGADPLNNFMIPLLLGLPFFFFLLNKMRQLAIAHHELFTLATTDSLTALLNRRAFTEMVNGYLKKAGAASSPVRGALLAIDVDHFKMINDRFGHDSGDEALKLIAATISSNVRDTDLVGRMGGEEFCVFTPGQLPEQIHVLAERLRLAISEAAFVARGQRHRLSVSVGGVFFDHDASFAELYRGADERLYCAKRTGRNRVELGAFKPSAAMQSISR
jgi:diguanylate cyclase